MTWIEHAIEWPFKEAGKIVGEIAGAAGSGAAAVIKPVVGSIWPILIIAAIVLIMVLPKMNLSLI